MKFKNILLAIGLCSSSLFFSSCDDFLTQDSQSYVTADDFYESIGDCEAGLTSVYNSLKQVNNYLKTDEMLRSDYGISGNLSSRIGFTSTSHLQTFTSADNAPKNKWDALYKCVLRANLLIEGVDHAEEYISEENYASWLTIKAEAYFFRGLFYFWLHNSFNNGDVIIYDFVPDEIEEYFQPLSKSEDVLAFYRKDLEYALELSADGGGLAEQWSSTSDLGRVTKYTAYAVLGMSYLYEVDEDNAAENYEKARGYFKTIIDSGKFELADVADNITTQGEFNSESILEASYTITFSNNQSGDALLYNTWGMSFADPGAWSTVTPALWLKDVYQNEPVDPKREENWIECMLDPDGDIYYDQNKLGDTYVYYLGTYDDPEEGSDETVGAFQYMQRITYVYQRANLTAAINESNATTNWAEWYEHTFMPYVYKKQEVLKTEFDENGDVKTNYSEWDVAVEGDVLSDYYTVKNNTTYGDYLDINANDAYAAANDVLVLSYATTNASQIPSLKLRWNPDLGRFEMTREFTRRASYSMALNGDETLDYYQGIPNTTASYGGDAGYFRKLTNWDIVEEESDMTDNASAINLRIIRYADILLMYAEALIEGGTGGNVGEAIDYINQVRYRAGAVLCSGGAGTYFTPSTDVTYSNDSGDESLTLGSAEAVMNHLMYVERPAELSLDGNAMRVCDMRRWSKSPAGLFNTRDRFRELSQKYVYGKGSLIYLKENTSFVGDVTTTTVLLTPTTNYGNWVYPYNSEDHTSFASDFLDAYTNYTDAANAYWPIPSTEEMANPNLKNY